ncbi:MAG: hypothetical protein V2A73_04265 [Pseudomonadota bacterium]
MSPPYSTSTPPLVTEGARVTVSREGMRRRAGVVVSVRLEPYLKTYAVRCDDGELLYASRHEVSPEGSPSEGT